MMCRADSSEYWSPMRWDFRVHPSNRLEDVMDHAGNGILIQQRVIDGLTMCDEGERLLKHAGYAGPRQVDEPGRVQRTMTGL